MLVVKVEIWPGGDCLRAERIAEATAANVSGLSEVSAYDCRVVAAGYEPLGISHVSETFRIDDHHRSDGALELVRRMFSVAILRTEAAKEREEEAAHGRANLNATISYRDILSGDDRE